MNAIILLLAIGSIETSAPSMGSLVAPDEFRQAQQPTHQEPLWVYQAERKVNWPDFDPRDPTKSKFNSTSTGTERAGSSGKAPVIRGSQLKTEGPNYEKSTTLEDAKTVGTLSKPRVNQDRRANDDDSNSTAPRETGRSKFSAGNQSEERDERVSPSTKPRFGESIRQASQDDDADFKPTTRMKTSVMRQSGGARESAPSPFEFRPASISDDPEESERVVPYKSFAIGAGDGEEDFDAEPYSAPLPNGRRGDEYLASSRGDVRDTKHSAEDGGESTLQGGKKVPGNGSESSMWGSLILVLLLFASMGGNLYLAWVAREFYERYRSLAQQVRSARNNLT